MNLAGFVDGGFPEVLSEYFPDDQLPETLDPFLRYLFADCGPAMVGMPASYNVWAQANMNLPAGTIVHNNPDQPIAHPPKASMNTNFEAEVFTALNLSTRCTIFGACWTSVRAWITTAGHGLMILCSAPVAAN